MRRQPSLPYLVATALAGVLAVASAWLPWVRKLPVGYTDGQPYYTSEFVAGMETGFRGTDMVILGPVIVALVVVAISTVRRWRPDVVVVLAGAFVTFAGWTRLQEFTRVDRYAPAPGVYLALAAGLVLLATGGSAFLRGYVQRRRDGRTT
ncbi:hypothetical protein [Haloarchaeobius sp. HME9146]|uniref:hypothetical protein n=1 Tax=Haloarchaeobius sp. HME9146 TaxID=2978732 RepID=UPI0021BE4489|nr:hypothetical protein [Haloarchaeobius sp. HME9146]MCT9096255.1 hypothetical protein [Haloarchaeobius sp. HME9146]